MCRFLSDLKCARYHSFENIRIDGVYAIVTVNVCGLEFVRAKPNGNKASYNSLQNIGVCAVHFAVSVNVAAILILTAMIAVFVFKIMTESRGKNLVADGAYLILYAGSLFFVRSMTESFFQNSLAYSTNLILCTSCRIT